MRDFQRGQSALGARRVGGSTTAEEVKVDEKNAGDGGAFPPISDRLLPPWPEVDSHSLTHPSLTNVSCRHADRGTKRKFELDASELDRLAQAAEDAAMLKISSEQAEARKAKLPAFWLPSLAPVADKEKVKVVKLETMCQASEHPHPLKCVFFRRPVLVLKTSVCLTLLVKFLLACCLRQKNLIEVKFTPLPSSSTSSTTAGKSNPSSCMCPACSKELTNSTQSVLLKGCGHVVCKKCCDEIVRPGKQCVQCDGVVGEKGLVELVRDGTGYAAAGGAQAVKKGGTSFPFALSRCRGRDEREST